MKIVEPGCLLFKTNFFFHIYSFLHVQSNLFHLPVSMILPPNSKHNHVHITKRVHVAPVLIMHSYSLCGVVI